MGKRKIVQIVQDKSYFFLDAEKRWQMCSGWSASAARRNKKQKSIIPSTFALRIWLMISASAGVPPRPPKEVATGNTFRSQSPRWIQATVGPSSGHQRPSVISSHHANAGTMVGLPGAVTSRGMIRKPRLPSSKITPRPCWVIPGSSGDSRVISTVQLG